MVESAHADELCFGAFQPEAATFVNSETHALSQIGVVLLTMRMPERGRILERCDVLRDADGQIEYVPVQSRRYGTASRDP